MAKMSNDWWRHLAAQVGGAAVLAALGAFGHADLSVLGPFATLVPALLAIATEGANQLFAKLDAPSAPDPTTKLNASPYATFAALAAVVLMLCGCAAQLKQAATDFNDIAAAASDPAVVKAAGTLAVIGQKVVCGVASASAFASVDASLFKNAALSNGVQSVYVTSSTICGQIGGTSSPVKGAS